MSPNTGPAEQWRAVDEYFADALVEEDEPLRAARESSRLTTMPHAAVSPNQAALLGILVQASGARRVLEFGTLAGYSTTWLARAVGPDGHVTTLELDEGNAGVARTNLDACGVGDRVEVMVGRAADSAALLIENAVEPFDFVFIDADKPSNPVYLAAAVTLTRPGALIVIDNVVRDGAVLDKDGSDPTIVGTRQVIEDVAANPALSGSAVQTVGTKGWDGFLVVRRG